MRLHFWLQLFIGFALCSCGRWDADRHYELQNRAIAEKIAIEKITHLKMVETNVSSARKRALQGVRIGMNARELENVAGYRFDPLARTAEGGQIWERRRYLLTHLVASRWGSFSEESKFCDKDTELFTVTLVNGIVREVDFGY
tara:strand:- start:741 stop:1169 length:429 start_codon:yes stop_codon:yes gene_type:complete